MNNKEIKVFIADDHDLIRQGLKRIIEFEDNLIVVGEANNGEKVLPLLNVCNPDIILLDMKMPVMDGLGVLKCVKNKGFKSKVIMLTVENDSRIIRDAITIGADGYVLKESAGEEIVNAIKVVYNGDKYIDRSLVSLLFSNFTEKIKEEHYIFDSLSKRELDILYYISRGYSNKEIGETLYISEKTVKNYASNLFRKIDVTDRVHATIVAIDNNIEEYYNNKNS
jgi:DNA-binding NarL/FixJ family response regulator